jgi:hypothetical protein
VSQRRASVDTKQGKRHRGVAVGSALTSDPSRSVAARINPGQDTLVSRVCGARRRRAVNLLATARTGLTRAVSLQSGGEMSEWGDVEYRRMRPSCPPLLCPLFARGTSRTVWLASRSARVLTSSRTRLNGSTPHDEGTSRVSNVSVLDAQRSSTAERVTRSPLLACKGRWLIVILLEDVVEGSNPFAEPWI